MNKKWLKSELIRLFDDYGVDKSTLESLSEEQIARGTKGHLATLDRDKTREYSQEDGKIIKDIFFYFG